MKKIKGDKPIGVTKHIYMEISQGNSLCSLSQASKNVNFSFFLSTKSENRRVEQVLFRVGS
jgi:hypothetical protein